MLNEIHYFVDKLFLTTASIYCNSHTITNLDVQISQQFVDPFPGFAVILTRRVAGERDGNVTETLNRADNRFDTATIHPDYHYKVALIGAVGGHVEIQHMRIAVLNRAAYLRRTVVVGTAQNSQFRRINIPRIKALNVNIAEFMLF